MASFTVRIELHGATGEDYNRLHAAMEAAGYQRYVAGVTQDGKSGHWALPTAEYDYSSSASAYAVRDHAKAIADTIKPESWCLVTQVAPGDCRAWSTKKTG